jgi:hypothetical protein
MTRVPRLPSLAVSMTEYLTFRISEILGARAAIPKMGRKVSSRYFRTEADGGIH